MADFQHIRIEDANGVTVVRFNGNRITDDGHIQQLGREMETLVAEMTGSRLLLNFEGVGFLSSAALGKLIKLDKIVKNAGYKIKLCSIKPEIYEVFSITKLDQQFDIKGNQSDALAAF